MTLAGSPIYTSPEMQSGWAQGKFDGKLYGASIDTFSLGVTLFRCLYGTVPFRTKDGEEPGSNRVLYDIYSEAKQLEL